jgi:ABC-type sulfate/molybdate transport systems ATPase subunit
MSLYVDIRKKFRGFDLDVKIGTESEVLGILGPSGSGKSMTLRCIAGLEKPDSGEIRINDRIVYSSDKKINLTPRERKVGFLFQNYALFPTMNVLENIRFGAGNGAEDKEYISNIIERFHLGDLVGRKPSQISGGQQQRVALARVLAAKPDLIMLDEPFSALDDHLRIHMLREMKEYLVEFNGSVLFVTHNIEEAYRMSDNIAIYSGGRIDSKGDKHQLFDFPPTADTARITGCKNIFRVERTSDGKAFAHELGSGLVHSSGGLRERPEWMFIRANHIQVWPDGHEFTEGFEKSELNVLDATVNDIVESPFKVTLFMETGGDGILQAEVPKDRWHEIMETHSKKVRVTIPRQRVVCA